jgi:hypothetical protein
MDISCGQRHVPTAGQVYLNPAASSSHEKPSEDGERHCIAARHFISCKGKDVT